MTKIYKLRFEMRKSYQGYIESENFSQSQSLVAFKIATEDWSVLRARVHMETQYTEFFCKTAQTKIWKLGLEMKKRIH